MKIKEKGKTMYSSNYYNTKLTVINNYYQHHQHELFSLLI